MTRWGYAILIVLGSVVIWIVTRVVPRELWHYLLFFLAFVIAGWNREERGYDHSWTLDLALLLAAGAGVLLGRLR